MSQNPLQKYFRQPKIFIPLPSKGLYYPSGALQGDYNNVPIFAMTGMDEIIFKTPDALFTGEATAKVIESCCPFVKNASQMPSIDIDAIMIAIRIATFGNIVSVEHKCDKCGAEHTYDIDLSTMLDYFNNLRFESTVEISDNLKLKIRPLQYNEMTELSIENFKLQKMLAHIAELPDEEKQKQIDAIYEHLSDLQLRLFLTSIEEVIVDGQIVKQKSFIEDWLRNTERDIYDAVKKKLEANKEAWNMPAQKIKCTACEHESSITVALDQSNFFG